jgi:hypothetical protein
MRRATALANASAAIQNWNKNPIGILVGNRKPGQCVPDFCENGHRSRYELRPKGVRQSAGPEIEKRLPGKKLRMQDALNLVMLVCAAVAALAFGVLAAYVICRAAFAALKMHARSYAVQAPQPKPEIARP